MSSVLQRLLHNLNLHSLLPSHRDSMVVVVGLGWCMTVLSLAWLSIYNKEWDITVIQPISSPSLLELFMKALVDIWIDLYLIKFQFLSILCVFVNSLEEFFITGVQSCPYWLSHPVLGWLYVFSPFPPRPPPQKLFPLTSKPFELNLWYLAQRIYGSGEFY